MSSGAAWVWDVELTSERGFGCGVGAPWHLNLSVVPSGDGCVLDSVSVTGGLAILPFQGDAGVCLGDAAEVPWGVQACVGDGGTFV